MINIIFSISFYIAIGFIFYILLKRRAFFSLFVLGLYSLYHLFVFILVAFEESFFWALFATLMSLLFWSWIFLLFFVPALFFDFWKAKRVAIQDSQPKSNQRQRTYLMIIIFLILISIGGVFYFFIKREQNISIKNEESSQFSVKNIIKNFGDNGIIVDSPKPNQIISSPLKITGYVDDNFGGGWEADFGSVELVDNDGEKLTSASLRVDATDDEGNYKERPYYFESTLVFNEPQTTEGFLIFYEHTARGDMTEKFRISVRFDKKVEMTLSKNLPQSMDVNDIYKTDERNINTELERLYKEEIEEIKQATQGEAYLFFNLKDKKHYFISAEISQDKTKLFFEIGISCGEEAPPCSEGAMQKSKSIVGIFLINLSVRKIYKINIPEYWSKYEATGWINNSIILFRKLSDNNASYDLYEYNIETSEFYLSTRFAPLGPGRFLGSYDNYYLWGEFSDSYSLIKLYDYKSKNIKVMARAERPGQDKRYNKEIETYDKAEFSQDGKIIIITKNIIRFDSLGYGDMLRIEEYSYDIVTQNMKKLIK